MSKNLILNNSLNAYSATRPPVFSAVGLHSHNWKIYATAAGSALAMASSASAGIIYSGSIGTVASVASVGLAGPDALHSSAKVFQLKNGTGGNLGISFGVFVQQKLASNNLTGYVGLTGSNVGFFFNFVSGKVKHLSSGARISALALGANSNFQGGLPNVFTRNHTQSGFVDSHGGWVQHSGFAGFEFTNNSVTDYGWVKLSFTTTANGAPGSVTVQSWAYEDTGAAINAGATASATPEPSTAGLAILAAGAAGIVALRRRRLKSN